MQKLVDEMLKEKKIPLNHKKKPKSQSLKPSILLIASMFFFCFRLFGENQKNETQSKASPQKTTTLSLQDAVYMTLQNQREIKIAEMNIIEQTGVIQESAGPFDPVLDASLDYIISEDRQYFPSALISDWGAHETVAKVSLNKQSRIGTRISMSAEVDQIIDPLGVLATTVPTKKSNQGFLSFSIEQPILRGLFYGKDATLEMANRQSLFSFVLEELHVVSSKITDTAKQYWEVVAAQNLLRIRDETVQRFEKLANKTEVLIANEEIAKSDIIQPEAQLEQARLNRVLAVQQLYAAMQILLFDLGIAESGYEIKPENFYVNDDFPEIPQNIPIGIQEAQNYIQYALFARNDIRALKVKESVADILIRGGYNELLPQLDLVASVNRMDFKLKGKYQPLYGSLDMPHPQTDYIFGVRFSYPIGNDAAKGNLTQQKSIKQRINLETQQLSQDTYKQILDAWSLRISLSRALRDIQIVVDKYQKLVENEQKKLTEGFSTLFVLIDFENKLTDALLQKVELQKLFMQNIADLRFYTSTVIIPSPLLDYYTIENVSKEPEITNQGSYRE